MIVKAAGRIAEAEFYRDKSTDSEHRFRMTCDGENVYHSSEGYKNAKSVDANFESTVITKWWPSEGNVLRQIDKIKNGEEESVEIKITNGKNKAKLIFYKSKDKYYWTFKYSNGRIGGSSPKGYDKINDCYINADLIIFNQWNVIKEEND